MYLACFVMRQFIVYAILQAILGRAKKVDVFDSKVHDEPAIPDANFNCFVCEKQVQPQMAISDAMDRSFVSYYFAKSS